MNTTRRPSSLMSTRTRLIGPVPPPLGSRRSIRHHCCALESRVPETERLLIGATLCDPEIYRREQANGLHAGMFVDPGMSHIWRAIGATLKDREAVSVERVGSHLADEAGLTNADLAALKASTADSSHLGLHVRESYAIREIERLPEPFHDLDSVAQMRAVARRVHDLVALVSPRRIDVHTDWKGAAPQRKWICESWLSYRLTLLTGDGGSGKSRLTLQLAAAVASGTPNPWIPPATGSVTSPVPPVTVGAPAPVLIASWEDERDEVHRRLEAMANLLPWAAPDRIENRLSFIDLAGEGPLWETTATGFKLTDTGAELRAIAEQIQAHLIIIDPRAAAYAGDENSRGHVRAFISHWDRWAREQQCAILLVDHRPKSTSATYAGSTDWRNGARSVWTLDVEDNKDATWLRCDKSNYGPPPAQVRLSSPDGSAWFAADASGEAATAGSATSAIADSGDLGMF